MIAWSIRAASASRCFDRIMVSTDDDEIADVARAFGAEVPFLRPAALSDDHTGTIPVIAHAIRWHNDHMHSPATEVCCIYATAPLLRPGDLQRSLDVLAKGNYDYAFSVTSYASPIQRALRIDTQQRVSMFSPEHFHTRSQDLEEAWHDAGQFYWGTAAAWLACKPLFADCSAAVTLPRYRVQDIDTLDDWLRAELLAAALENNPQEQA